MSDTEEVMEVLPLQPAEGICPVHYLAYPRAFGCHECSLQDMDPAYPALKLVAS